MNIYDQNRDLILLSFFGYIYYAIIIAMNGHLTNIPMGEYFLVPFIVSIFMGISVVRSSQMLEWPLCFLFGGTLGSITIIGVLSLLGMSFNFYDIVFTINTTFAWFGAVSAMILLGILLGAFFRATYLLVLGSLRMSFD